MQWGPNVRDHNETKNSVKSGNWSCESFVQTSDVPAYNETEDAPWIILKFINIFFSEINTFIKQECIQFIKVKTFILLQRFLFQINASIEKKVCIMFTQ